jgi:hypothetical protein
MTVKPPLFYAPPFTSGWGVTFNPIFPTLGSPPPLIPLLWQRQPGTEQSGQAHARTGQLDDVAQGCLLGRHVRWRGTGVSRRQRQSSSDIVFVVGRGGPKAAAMQHPGAVVPPPPASFEVIGRGRHRYWRWMTWLCAGTMRKRITTPFFCAPPR